METIAGLAEYDEMEGIAWRWQSVDGASGKAPLAQECVGPNPTDREEKWAQAHPAGGRAWHPAIARRQRANQHDSRLLGAALGAVVCPCPRPCDGLVERLCADAGYVGFPA